MTYTRTAALAAIGLAAALSLTACGDDSGSGSGSAKDTSANGTPAAPAADGGAQSQGGSGSGGAQAGDGTTGSGGNGGAQAASNGSAKTTGKGQSGGKVTFCKTANLAISARYAAAGKTEGRINVTMVNRGAATCSATGFAGVDIKDADHTSNPVERGSAQPRITTLKPGEAAVFDLAYTIDPSGKSLASPTNILVTPPNETHTANLKWPSGAGAIKGAYTDVQVYPTHTAE
ncbi:DUF4232 domain-containing protein [Streptomyces sp. NPDC059070]|uniref:DUF4232 domain-containing protein n=1 Tax=Streptomyces sp. NPDC059070 TaxID=3346713 RepID=UPI00369B55CB